MSGFRLSRAIDVDIMLVGSDVGNHQCTLCVCSSCWESINVNTAARRAGFNGDLGEMRAMLSAWKPQAYAAGCDQEDQDG